MPASVAASASTHGFGHEELLVRRGRRSGLTIAVAVHSTALGPALGGLRMWGYPDPSEGIDDVLRLARGMTLKAAAAGLDLGGGKGVICAPPGAPALAGVARERALRDFAELVDELEGRYITAEDVGTSSADMSALRRHTEHVVGLPAEEGGAGDPSPFTALGVEAAIRGCVAHLEGAPELRGLRVVVVGLGHVGGRLAELLAGAGAELLVTDLDPSKRALAQRLGASWVEPAAAATRECDVLSLCALGGQIDAGNVGSIGARAICGAANNQLADEAVAETLRDRGVLYAPDFLVNSGGLISCYREIHAEDAEWALERTLAIEQTMTRLLELSDERGITPLAAAHELAAERLGAVVRN